MIKVIDMLYNNIDKKLKVCAVIVLIVGIVLSSILAFSCFTQANEINEAMAQVQNGFFGSFVDDSYKDVSGVFTKIGLYVLVYGVVLSVGFSLALYGIGFIAERFINRTQNLNSVQRPPMPNPGVAPQYNAPQKPPVQPNLQAVAPNQPNANDRAKEMYRCHNCNYVNSVGSNRCANCGAPNPNFEHKV